MNNGEHTLLALNGAIIRYLAANHASLVESYDDPEAFSAIDLVYACITEVRDAAQAVLTETTR